MPPQKMCVDIDNVIAQTDAVMRQVISEVTSGQVALEYENVQRFNYWECVDANQRSITREEWNRVHDLFSESSRILSIEPMDGAIEVLERLAGDYKLHFATSRLSRARRATVEWLERHNLDRHDLHFVKHGEKHSSLGQFDVSVEDDPSQAEAFARQGIALNFVLAHPWNESVTKCESIHRVPSWQHLAAKLLGLFRGLCG